MDCLQRFHRIQLYFPPATPTPTTTTDLPTEETAATDKVAPAESEMRGEGRLYDRSVLTGLVPDPLLGVIDSLPPHRAAAYFNANIQVGGLAIPTRAPPATLATQPPSRAYARTFIDVHLQPPFPY
jgi:hypothetical protein